VKPLVEEKAAARSNHQGQQRWYKSFPFAHNLSPCFT
jgi:hypothetical protein